MTAASEREQDTGYLYQKEVVRSVKPRSRRAAKPAGSLITMVMVIFAAGLMTSYYFARLYTLNYQLDTLNSQLKTLQAGTQDLDASVSRYSSLAYVEQVATKQLGMVLPSGKDVLTVSVAPTRSVPAAAGPKAVQTHVYAERNPLLAAFYQMVSRFQTKVKSS